MIPTSLQRFSRSSKPKLLGVAYIEFVSAEDVEEAVAKVNGITYKNRILRARFHEPYKPHKSVATSQTPEAEDVLASVPINAQISENVEAAISANIEAPEPVDGDVQAPEPVKEEVSDSADGATRAPCDDSTAKIAPWGFSTNTVFLKKVNCKVSNSELTEAFIGYKILQISNTRSSFGRSPSFSFRNKFVNKLVTLDIGDLLLEDIVQELKARPLKLRNAVVDVLVSFAQRSVRKPTPLNVANKAAATQAVEVDASTQGSTVEGEDAVAGADKTEPEGAAAEPTDVAVAVVPDVEEGPKAEALA